MQITLHSKWKYVAKTKSGWRKWLKIAQEQDPELYGFWATLECCSDCIYIDKEAFWCEKTGLPNSYNPVLGDLGMACCGFAHTKFQPELFDKIPF